MFPGTLSTAEVHGLSKHRPTPNSSLDLLTAPSPDTFGLAFSATGQCKRLLLPKACIVLHVYGLNKTAIITGGGGYNQPPPPRGRRRLVTALGLRRCHVGSTRPLPATPPPHPDPWASVSQSRQSLCDSRPVPHVQRSALQPLHRRRHRPRGARDLPEGRDGCRPLRSEAHVSHPEVLPVFRHALNHLRTSTTRTRTRTRPGTRARRDTRVV